MKIQANTPWLADGYNYKLFELDTLKKQNVRPSDKDSFSLDARETSRPFTEFRVATPTIHSRTATPDVALQNSSRVNQRRIKSASAVRLQDKQWRHTKTTQTKIPTRPTSAASEGGRPSGRGGFAQRRINSAGPVTASRLMELKKGFTLVNKMYENENFRDNITLHPASPAPDYRYFDRHSRCLDHNHIHQHLQWDRPSQACDKPSTDSCTPSRPESSASMHDPFNQPARYIDYHRPKTAPGTRKDLQYLPRHNYVYRGRAPHFCNFVYQVQLHDRGLDRPDTARTGNSDYGSERELIEEFVAGRRIGQWRKNSNSSSSNSTLTIDFAPPRLEDYDIHSVNSGTEGRPVSPSSTEDSVDDVTLLRDGHFINIHNIEVKVSPVSEQKYISSLHNGDVDFNEYDQEFNDADGISSISGKKSDKDSLSISTLTIPPDSSASGSGMDRLKAHNVPPVHIPSQSEIEEADQLSPRQPPPTPETLPISTDEKSPPAKKKACITKKTKKSVDRTRKKMEDDEAENQAPEPLEVEIPHYQDEESSPKKEPKIDIVLPELPTSVTKEKTTKHKEKPTKNFIPADDFFKPDPSETNEKEILNERLRERRADFDFSGLETANIMEDLKRAPPTRSFQGRLALSQQSCRFELPMDMQLLETMKPEEYIRKHCKITSRRKTLYKQVFLKYKDKGGTLLLKDVEKSLKDVLVNTISSEQVTEICDILQLNNDTKIDQTLFSGIASFAERVLYPKFVTEETADMQEYQREKIECADFSALDWKFHGVKVNDAMHRLLKMLA